MTKAELYEKAKMLPLLPGVYIIRDKRDEIIYIGKAKRLRTRVSQYFREGVPHDAKVTQMIEHAFAFDVIVCQSEFEALVLEASQIKAHTPKYNILLKDDKGYSYVKITKGEYPRISAALQKDDDEADYIGPFTSSFAVRQMVETAQDSFLLPRCNRRFPEDIGKGRPCLNAHIGKCMALCSGKISKEVYGEAVKGAIQLIRHGKKDILTVLRRRMEEAAERLDFEQAALLRDQIAAVEKVSAGQKVVVDETVEMDVMAFAASGSSSCAAILRYRRGRLADKREFVFKGSTDLEALREEFLPRYYLYGGEIPRRIAVDALPEAAEALEQLLGETRGAKVQLYVPQRGDVAQLVTMAYTNAVERLARESGRTDRGQRLLDETAALLGLEKPPHIIESYDISNWGEGTSVCGMVVFQDGRPLKSGYRRFKMRTVFGTDDFASMAEALSRRAGEYEKGAAGQFGVLPDLILLDGGKGQVSAVKSALAGTALAAVPLFGMVKDDHHRTRAIVTAEGGEIAVSMHRGVFTFLSNIQEEVHRFSIEYQRASQKKKSYASSLTAIPGVGPATAKALLAHFKTVGAVRQASAEELEQAKGVGAAAARRVYDWFHSGAALDKAPGTGDNEP
ncbi:MAG TPA: excinuclease ABC subunit UvrC [Candidatus Fournierella pullicola]|uniref:UvrABC system protein C n=1 Tax=Candidatus Allofournierella pullicola TaxID=2838596 RepID=A0A9D1V4K6_9FIRM|nr:excinuclease ABC subunit UvrC [Candidatus Fournierella pullicola]